MRRLLYALAFLGLLGSGVGVCRFWTNYQSKSATDQPGESVPARSERKPGQINLELADQLLRDEPLTIVFRRIRERPAPGATWRWYWSINSAGVAELTTTSGKNPTVARVSFPADRLAGVRKALRDDRFVRLKDEYGPPVLHGGWSTLTIVCGEHINKTVTYHSLSAWVRNYRRADLAEAAPALRIWLSVAEMVDPDGTVFDERKDLAEAILALKE